MIRVRIESFDYDSATSIFIYRRREDGGIDMLRYDPIKQLSLWHKYTAEESTAQSHNFAPTIKFFAENANEIRKALADALGKSGFISESHEGAHGKLEATEKHLEDMRTLVFKKDADTRPAIEIKRRIP